MRGFPSLDFSIRNPILFVDIGYNVANSPRCSSSPTTAKTAPGSDSSKCCLCEQRVERCSGWKREASRRWNFSGMKRRIETLKRRLISGGNMRQKLVHTWRQRYCGRDTKSCCDQRNIFQLSWRIFWKRELNFHTETRDLSFKEISWIACSHSRRGSRHNKLLHARSVSRWNMKRNADIWEASAAPPSDIYTSFSFPFPSPLHCAEECRVRARHEIESEHFLWAQTKAEI